MRSKGIRIAAFGLGAGIGLIFSTALFDEAASSDDTPGCATHNEFDRIESFMYPATVADIVGNDGSFVDTDSPETFARRYDACWSGDHVKVWFEQDSRFSFRKDVV